MPLSSKRKKCKLFWLQLNFLFTPSSCTIIFFYQESHGLRFIFYRVYGIRSVLKKLCRYTYFLILYKFSKLKKYYILIITNSFFQWFLAPYIVLTFTFTTVHSGRLSTSLLEFNLA